MVGGDSFVQHVVTTNKRALCIVLCTDQQIADIKNFCCVPNGSVLSFDKTYNLGSFFVTPITYKNLVLKQLSSGSEPIFLNPFFHANSDATTFFFFFSRFFTLVWHLPTQEI
jgi:hypothetical protein